ncbi:MAG: flavodoxin-dependent (E)-4-hydroxy-3-methylbut-2-enyl-diphosphate synthase [Candidatus Aureabacteria bacterium]|nr:flavodoxin-dependent (E)-4-hydroxy-3-methylbut-2-enyl-diphosphate synthase [Candidatus Auribacterota bacterium]
MDIIRKKTKKIIVGGIAIGAGAPISIQSMTKTHTEDVAATVAQIQRLARAGCEIVRVAVPDEKAARAIGAIMRRIRMPLIADIHFDHRLALIAIKEGADGIRINPGNIGGVKKLAGVAKAAAAAGIPIRVGVNAGSVEKDLLNKHGGPTPAALAESAMRGVKRVEDAGHAMIKISVKASSVLDTVEAYERVARLTRYPLHVGVTEAGPLLTSAIRSSAAVGHLLIKGIGDTIRVSVTGDPVEEVAIARELLQSLGLREFGPVIVSCPTCGRCNINVGRVVAEIQRAVAGIRTPLTIAVMGCAVNGPGEAREADLGLAGGKGSGVLFRKGRVIRTVKEPDFVRALLDEINNWGHSL